MRDILFRAKCRKSNEWVYGDLRQFIHFNGKRYVEVCLIKEQGHSAKAYEVTTESVGQFTGITDKNGNKVFEGDVIGYYGSKKGFEIKYSNDGRLVWVKPEGQFTINAIEIHDPNQLEIIGNIHDKNTTS